jgi:choline dehydrogenase-like flavoprotein
MSLIITKFSFNCGSGSAQLLLLSGVGPKEDMEELDIPLMSDVAVGRNLKHSVFVELDYNIKNQSLIERPQMSTDTEFEYYNDRTGPLAYIASALHCFSERAEEGTGLTNGCVLPHIDFLDEKSDKLIAKVNLKTEWDEYYKQYLGHSVLKLKAILRRPKSTGSLYLVSDNAMVRPVIDPKIFDIQSDIDDLVETLNQSLRIYNSEFMSEFVEPFESPVPGCRPCADDRFCEAYLRCLVYTITDYPYLVGTCRMGPKEDPNAVVDERFRVRGVTGLRVIDASVLPMATEQTVAIVVMLAERGVTFIEEDNKGSTKLPELKLNLTSFNNIFNTNWIPTPKD